MKMQEIKELSDKELVHKELELERNLIDSRLKRSLGVAMDVSVFGTIRKDIARLQTEQTFRCKEQGLSKNALKARYRKSFVYTQEEKEESGDFLTSVADKLS